ETLNIRSKLHVVDPVPLLLLD
ncbi:unnamed protein product, partial [Allacma fusca]